MIDSRGSELTTVKQIQSKVRILKISDFILILELIF